MMLPIILLFMLGSVAYSFRRYSCAERKKNTTQFFWKVIAASSKQVSPGLVRKGPAFVEKELM